MRSCHRAESVKARDHESETILATTTRAPRNHAIGDSKNRLYKNTMVHMAYIPWFSAATAANGFIVETRVSQAMGLAIAAANGSHKRYTREYHERQ